MDLVLKSFISAVIIIVILNYIVNLFQRSKKASTNELTHYLNNIIHTVEIENINGIDYWFDADKSSFLAQGKNDEEVICAIKRRFPDHVFLLKGKGGIASDTNWQIVPFEELKISILSRYER